MAEQGIIARAIVAVRYAMTGVAPQDWFGPNTPLAPMAPPEVAGRQYDYRVGINLNYTPRVDEPVGFAKLKALAKYDLVRMVIEGQKDKLEALTWSIKPREQGGRNRTGVDQGAIDIQTQLEYPDRIHDWGQWLRALLDQNFVLDAVSIYRRKDRGGRPWSFELLDGATIKPLADAGGRIPQMPDASYQQILKGVPAVDYTTDELIYFPQNFRVDHAYGYSRVEQAIDIIETGIDRLRSQKSYFKFGNLSDGFFEAPAGVNPDQITQVETLFNSIMAGNIENRRQAPFLPAGFKYNAIGTPPLQDQFDEWLIRVICFCFSTSPTPFLKQAGLGHGSAQSEHEAAEAAGLANTMGYVSRLMNRILAEDFARPDLEFAWTEDREFDPETKARIEDMQQRNGVLTLNQVRDRNGEEPVEGGDVPLLYSGSGWVRLQDIVADPEPVPDALAQAAQNMPGGGASSEPDPALGQAKGDADAAIGAMAKAAPAARQRRLAAALGRYLAAKAKEIAPVLGEKLGLAKVDPAEEGYDRRIDDAFEAIDWTWDDLIPVTRPMIAGISTAAGKKALDELGLFDKTVMTKMTAAASDYAGNRAAELVGRKLVDGELVDNPGWSIPSATRDMLRSTITEAMEQGASNDDLAKAIMESDAFSRTRAETIARTETAMADTNGQRAGWRASGVVGGQEWVASENCCDDCQDLDGTVVGIDEGFPGGADVPLHPNCLPGDALVLASGITAVSERPFEGNVIIISTASGKRLTCTPNHPILTPDGWMAARLLNIGGHVVSSGLVDRVSIPCAGYDTQYVPSRIEDVAKAFRRSRQVSSVEVPVSAPDFHGDGEGSQIAVIWANGFLVRDGDAALAQHPRKRDFILGDVEAALHDGAGTLDLLSHGRNPASCGLVGGGRLGAPLVSGKTLGPDQTGSTCGASLNAVTCENARDSGAQDAEALRHAKFGNTTAVQLHNSVLIGDRSRSDLDSALLQGATYHGSRDPSFPCDLSNIHAAKIFVDTVVDIDRVRFSGHVFNLDTESGFYIADGIVTHNCECAILPVLPEDMPDASDDTETDDE